MSAFGDLWRFSLHIKWRLWNSDAQKTSRHSRAAWGERSELEDPRAPEPPGRFNYDSLFLTAATLIRCFTWFCSQYRKKKKGVNTNFFRQLP